MIMAIACTLFGIVTVLWMVWTSSLGRAKRLFCL